MLEIDVQRGYVPPCVGMRTGWRRNDDLHLERPLSSL